MQTYSAEVVFPARCLLGEGSIWDAESGRLYWVDIVDHKVFAFDPTSGANLAYDVGQSVGTVVVCKSGRLLVALRHGIHTLDPATGELSLVVDPEAEISGNRFNDGKCDPQGRFWAGTMVERGERGGAALYCLDTDLKIDKRIDHVTTSNGLVWSRDSTTFFYIDTPTREVRAYDFESSTGALSNPRSVLRIDPSLGSPDGMTIDSEDHLWIALWRGHQVIKVDPTTGLTKARVDVAAENVTSCAFGGKALDELYITTASVSTSPEKRDSLPRRGSLFRAKVGARGVPAARFAGAL